MVRGRVVMPHKPHRWTSCKRMLPLQLISERLGRSCASSALEIKEKEKIRNYKTFMGRLLESSNAESWVLHSSKRLKINDLYPEPKILYMEKEPKGLSENSGESNLISDNERQEITSDISKDSQQKDSHLNQPSLSDGGIVRRNSNKMVDDGTILSTVQQQFHAGMILPDMKDLAPKSSGQNP
eukprot:768456-Hanusia_phi.AAC.12